MGSQIDVVSLDNYVLAASFCRSTHIHGGVAIFVRKSIKFKNFQLASDVSIEMDLEMCAVKLVNYNVCIFCLYSSPDRDFKRFCEGLTYFIDQLPVNNRIICVGDFNVDFAVDSTNSKYVKNLLNGVGLTDCVSDYTRVTTTTKSRVDNIFTNIDSCNFEARVIEPGFSDHRGLLFWCKLSNKINDENGRAFRIVSDHAAQNYRLSVLDVDWSELYTSAGVEQACLFLLNSIVVCWNESFTLKYIRSGEKKTICYSSKIKTMKEHLLMLHDFSRTYPEYIAMYKDLKNKYRAELKKETINYNTSRIKSSTNKQKTTWTIIRPHRHSTVCEISASEMNDYFSSVGSQLINTISVDNSVYLSDIGSRSTLSSFFLEPVGVDEVARLVDELSGSRSHDYYGLNSLALKLVKDELIVHLAYFVNLCFEKGHFPNCLKKSRVVPIFKKGNKKVCANYRPISIVPVLSKLLELAFKSRLEKYLEKYSILNPGQYGFRSNKSTVKALTDLYTFVTDELERGNLVAGEFLDLTKAFDCVSHEILHDKLESYGIRGPALSFIDNFLRSRYQAVQGEDIMSDLRLVEYGVPQGSILGPILFIIYVNDIDKYVTAKNIEYADDTTLLVSDRNVDGLNEVLAESLSKAENYFSNIKLMLNREKSQALTFSLNPRIGLIHENSIKCLGLTFDARLTWGAHVDGLCNRLSTCIFMLKNLRSHVDRSALLMAYYALFNSRMSYGILLWGGSVHINGVLVMQKRAIRIIMGRSVFDSCRPLFKELGVMTCVAQFVLACIMYARENLELFPSQSAYNTRHEQYIQPHFRLSKNLNSFRYLAIKFYNLLPRAWKTQCNSAFVRRIKMFLKDNPIYSVQEFIDLVRDV